MLKLTTKAVPIFFDLFEPFNDLSSHVLSVGHHAKESLSIQKALDALFGTVQVFLPSTEVLFVIARKSLVSWDILDTSLLFHYMYSIIVTRLMLHSNKSSNLLARKLVPQGIDSMGAFHGQRVIVPRHQDFFNQSTGPTGSIKKKKLFSHWTVWTVTCSPRCRLLTHSRSSWYLAMSRSYLGFGGFHNNFIMFHRTWRSLLFTKMLCLFPVQLFHELLLLWVQASLLKASFNVHATLLKLSHQTNSTIFESSQLQTESPTSIWIWSGQAKDEKARSTTFTAVIPS